MTKFNLTNPYGAATQARVTSADYDLNVVEFDLLDAQDGIVQQRCTATASALPDSLGGQQELVKATVEAQRAP